MTLDKTFAPGEILSAGDVNGHLLSMWIPIDKRVVLSGSPVSTFTFSGLDTNFRLFRVTFISQPSAGGLYLRFNNDSGSSAYSWQYSYADDTLHQAFRQAADNALPTGPGNSPATSEFIIAKFAANQRARVQGVGSGLNNSNLPLQYTFSGVWHNTSSLINRIDLNQNTGTTYGVVALEGMRGV